MWSVWLYHIFPRCLINSMSFGQKLLNIKCVFWFSLQIFARNISHSKKNSARYYHKCTRYFFLPVNETLIFSTDFSKNTQIPNFMKIRPVRTELFRADRQTTKLIVAFDSFADAPKNVHYFKSPMFILAKKFNLIPSLLLTFYTT